MTQRAAHFLLLPQLWNSPPNDALTRVYQKHGYKVDMYCPESGADYGNHTLRPAHYGVRWILRNILNPRWRHYDVFSCTSEDPVAVAGLLAFIWRKPLIFLSDEIKSGSYYGNRPESWKRLCRWAMRRAALTIVNDKVRIRLQRDYASLSREDSVVVYPGCFVEPPQAGNAQRLRQENDISSDQLVISFSGYLSLYHGIDWALEGLEHLPNAVMLVQPLSVDGLSSYLLKHHQFKSQLRLSERRLSWQDSWSSMGGVDIGVSLYRNPSPQFQNMGISSNRLCMFLAMGVPVIVDRQASFQFIEDYNCGVMIDGPEEFVQAVKTIQSKLPEMKANALKCASEYIDTADHLAELDKSLAPLLDA